LTSEQESELQTLGTQLQRKYGSLKEIIEKYGGPSVLLLEGGNYKCEAFSSAFNYTLFSPDTFIVVVDANTFGIRTRWIYTKKLASGSIFPHEGGGVCYVNYLQLCCG